MSIKRVNSQTYTQRNSERLDIKDNKSNTQARVSNVNLLKESTKQQIAPDKIKLIRRVFTTISNSQPMPIERFPEALLALDYNIQKDLSFDEFFNQQKLNKSSSDLLDFKQFVLLILEYEEKLRLEEESLRRLDLKIAFECFDINKDGRIDANDLSNIMNILKFPITDQEAKEMIEFADHDKDSLLSFDEFLTILTQISVMNIQDKY